LIGGLRPGDILPDSATLTADGHLALGGCDLVQLAKEFGTPLYVYDEATIRARAAAYREALKAAYPGETLVCYAAKAYCAPWLLQVINQDALGLDVVSGGELYAALQSGFPAERIYFHGNNKSADELRMALEAGIKRVVVDNLEEVDRLAQLGKGSVLIRVAPGVEAHTHEHIRTGVLDTKFGLSLETGAAEEAVRAVLRAGLQLWGLHAHIGSQVLDMEPYRETVRRVLRFAGEMRDRHGMELRELSPGGGFGTRYSTDDEPATPPVEVARMLAEVVEHEATAVGFEPPAITIEPGRSIVGPAAVALYSVGSIKRIEGVRTYVALDGGMADNIRPTAYGAKYSALLANRATEAPTQRVALAGRYCESGDVLIKDIELPAPRVGDLVAVPGSGAYHMSMSSNYNLVPRPAVVVVREGRPWLVRRRETYADLLSPEIW
jgi:diaminopimelate decarboxylase